jgi:hypothetical protein
LKLVSLQNPILKEGTIGTGTMSAVKSAYNIGWWIIKNDLHPNCYFSILFDGINLPSSNLNGLEERMPLVAMVALQQYFYHMEKICSF